MSAAADAAEDMSAAVVVAVAVVGDVEAGAVPTSGSSEASSCWCGFTNGLELYRFRYKGSRSNSICGRHVRREVQQIEPSAVSRDHDGYLMVNYDRIGLKFMTWKEWLARNGASSLP